MKLLVFVNTLFVSTENRESEVTQQRVPKFKDTDTLKDCSMNRSLTDIKQVGGKTCSILLSCSCLGATLNNGVADRYSEECSIIVDLDYTLSGLWLFVCITAGLRFFASPFPPLLHIVMHLQKYYNLALK